MASFYEHYQIPYDFNQVNNLYDHNYYDNNQQQQFGFDPLSYNWNGSEYETTSVAYSVSTMSEPKHLFYDPNVYTTYEPPPQLRIYCSVQGFNEPEFEEYDPTPYGGGYDIVATYGKPLPQSVDICYPSSTAAQGKPPSPPEVIAPVPIGIYDGGEKKVVKKRVTFSEPLEEVRPLETVKEEEEKDYQEEEADEGEDEHEARPLETVKGEKENDYQEEEEDEGVDEDDDEEGEEEDEDEDEEEEEDHSLSYETTKPETVDKEEVKALYVPSGYGLEATDLCEVIFGGYFPCVLRNKRLQEDEKRAAEVSCWESTDSDPWKTTSDYLFGDSYPYGYENRVERSQFEISSYGYQRY